MGSNVKSVARPQLFYGDADPRIWRGFGAQLRQLSSRLLACAALVGADLTQARAKDIGRPNWTVLRSVTPDGRPNVSISKTADISRSDPEFAGIMVCCGPSRSMEVLIDLVQPFAPRSLPYVTIEIGERIQTLKGLLASGGEIVVLPPEATALIAEVKEPTQFLTFIVKEKDTQFKGVISIEGFRAARASLIESCAR